MEIYAYIRARMRRGRGGDAASASAALDWFRTLWTRACAPGSRGRPRARPASNGGGTTRVLTGTLARVLPRYSTVLTGACAGNRGVLPGYFAAEGRAYAVPRRTNRARNACTGSSENKHTKNTQTNEQLRQTNRQTNPPSWARRNKHTHKTQRDKQTNKQTNLLRARALRAHRAGRGQTTASLTCMSAQSHRHTSTSPPAAVRPRP
jgi:hypothetical protein